MRRCKPSVRIISEVGVVVTQSSNASWPRGTPTRCVRICNHRATSASFTDIALTHVRMLIRESHFAPSPRVSRVFKASSISWPPRLCLVRFYCSSNRVIFWLIQFQMVSYGVCISKFPPLIEVIQNSLRGRDLGLVRVDPKSMQRTVTNLVAMSAASY